MKRSKNVLIASFMVTFLVLPAAFAGESALLEPISVRNRSDLDTLTWRTLDQPSVNFCDGDYYPGDSVAVWFKPLAPCSLLAIRFYSYDLEATCLADVWDGSRYDGHIITTDSTDSNGWIGNYENGRWTAGPVLGHSPIGWSETDPEHHLWGPFPFVFTEQHTRQWFEIPVAAGLQGEVDMGDTPFLISIVFYPHAGCGMAAEDEGTTPFHSFRYYEEENGPDGQHSGWFIHSASVWYEAVVKYYEPFPGVHLTLLDFDIDDDGLGRSQGNGNGYVVSVGLVFRQSFREFNYHRCSRR